MNVTKCTMGLVLLLLAVAVLLVLRPWESLLPAPEPTLDLTEPAPVAHAPTATEDPAPPEPEEPPATDPVTPWAGETPRGQLAAEGTAPPVDPPTATPEPPAYPEPTPDVAALSAGALQLFGDGDYEGAIPLIQGALPATEGTEAERLRVLLGRALYESYSHRAAIDTLTQLDTAVLSREEAVQALGYLARAHEAVAQWREAISAYERLLALEDSASDRVLWQMALAYAALDEPTRAVERLRQINLAPLSASRQAEILEKTGDLLRQAGDVDGAVATYASILEFAQNAPYRAMVLQKQAETLREAGRTEEALPVLRRVVTEYTSTGTAAVALAVLDGLGDAEVDTLARAVALYHGQRYHEALEVLLRHRRAYPDVAPDRVAYHVGLSYHALQRYDEAIAEFDLIIDRYPGGGYAADAWMAKADSLAAKGLDPSSFYEQFYRTYPDSARAPAALWTAAERLQRARAWPEAGYYYRLLRTAYPADSSAPEATFREGLMAYAGTDYAQAVSVWEEALAGATQAEDRARLLLWLGLGSRRNGDETAARSYLEQAARTLPDGYYGVRAADLLEGVTIGRPPVTPVDASDGALSEEDWREIGDWVRGWAGAAPDTVPDHAAQPAVRRAVTLWDLGWHSEATTGLVAYRDGITNDSHAVLSLGRLCYERGVLPISIWAADRLAVLARRAGAPGPPRGLLKLAYPTSYAHLISAWGQEYGVDPLLFLALVRQESRFDPRARSWAGALGLTQVIPSTGAEIAQSIGPSGYRHEMLTRPHLSVQFGVWYMGRLLDLCNGDWIAALASYNGGYGNVQRWSGGLPIQDHDLFYELIGFGETRSYIRIIYVGYRTYRELYGG